MRKCRRVQPRGGGPASPKPIVQPMSSGTRPPLQLEVDGRQVEVPDRGASLLDVLREDLGLRSPKDGCSPQGQCGCCTVLVDGQPRVACVTPARRVAGRSVTTVDGLPDASRAAGPTRSAAPGPASAASARPGSSAGLEGLPAKGADGERRRPPRRGAGPPRPPVPVHRLAHDPRRLGRRHRASPPRLHVDEPVDVRQSDDPQRRRVARPGAGGTGGGSRAGRHRRCRRRGAGAAAGSPTTARPLDALVAVPDGTGRLGRGRDAGRGPAPGRGRCRAGGPPSTPDRRSRLPPGEWAATLRTSWVEPGYLEPDATVVRAGGEPASPLANGGAFGGKLASPVLAAARAARRPARPRRAGGARPRGRGAPRTEAPAGAPAGRCRTAAASLRVVRTAGIAAAVAAVAPDLVVEEVDVAGPPTSVELRAAGWAEAVVLSPGPAGPATPVVDPVTGAAARGHHRRPTGTVRVRVQAGDPLDEVVLRSYATGAAHMALSWVSSEGIAVDDDGVRPRPHDPLVRHPPGRRHPARSWWRSYPVRAPPVRRRRRGVRRRGRRRLAPRRHADRLADGTALALTGETRRHDEARGPVHAHRAGRWVARGVGPGRTGRRQARQRRRAVAELRQAIANLRALLESEGSRLHQVVKTTVFLRHLGNDYGPHERGLRRVLRRPPPRPLRRRRRRAPARCAGGGGSVGPHRGRMTRCSAH